VAILITLKTKDDDFGLQMYKHVFCVKPFSIFIIFALKNLTCNRITVMDSPHIIKNANTVFANGVNAVTCLSRKDKIICS